MIALALLIAAFILFILAAIPVPSRVALGWAGLACWVLAEILGRGALLH